MIQIGKVRFELSFLNKCKTIYDGYRSTTITGCRFSSKTSYTFTLILQSAKVSKYPQSIKIRFSTQSIKISAVSTPILTIKAPFFSIFQALTENLAENPSNFQKSQKTFAPNFGNSAKMPKTLQYFDILAVLCTLILYWIFILLL